MSFKWVNHILEERRDLRGTELLCAMIIANYASTDDKCYPGMERIAYDMRSTVRQAQKLVRRLEMKQVFRIIPGNGRGRPNSFLLIKGEQTDTLSEKGKGELSGMERVNFRVQKGELLGTPSYKEEPFKPLRKPERENEKPLSPEGSRISADFSLTEAMQRWAKINRSDINVDVETTKFVNHYRTKAGADAVKIEWELVWQNWILNARVNDGNRALSDVGRANRSVEYADPSEPCGFCQENYCLSTHIDEIRSQNREDEGVYG